MVTIIIFFILIICICGFFGGIYGYRRSKYHKKQVEQSLKMVPLLISVPRDMGEKENQGMRNQTDIARELIANAENMYNTIFGLYSGGTIKKKIKNFIYRAPHISLEIVAHDKEIFFYVVVPYEYLSLVEKSITAQMPDASIERVEEPNIFQPKKNMGVTGGDVWGYKEYYYPVKTYQEIADEPLEALTNTLSMLEENEGAAFQMLIRPVDPKMMTSAKHLVKRIQEGPVKAKGFTVGDVIKGNTGVKSTEQKSPEAYRTTPAEEQMMKDLDRKSSKFGFETRIRFIIAAQNNQRADLIFGQFKSALAQYSDLQLNGLRLKRTKKYPASRDELYFSLF